MNRRTVILLGVLAVSVLLALVLRNGQGGGGGVSAKASGERPTQARQARRGSEPEPVHDVVVLRSAELDAVQAGYEPGRDPFRFYQAPKPPPPPPVPVKLPEPTPQPTIETPPPEPEGPRPPPIELEYLGSFGPQKWPIAVFTDGEEIYNVRLGDVIDGNFRVVRIGYESVDLAFVDFPEVPAERLPIGRPNGG